MYLYYISISEGSKSSCVYSIYRSKGVTYTCYNSKITKTIVPVVKLVDGAKLVGDKNSGSITSKWEITM